jgi:hypothetical protein
MTSRAARTCCAGTHAVELDARGQCAGVHEQVAPLHRRVQVGTPGRHAQTARGGDLVVAYALGRGAVEAGIERQTGLGAGAQEALAKGMRITRHVAHLQRACAPAQFVVAVRAAFEALEVRQHLAPAPARVAQRAPVVEILGLATHEDHRIDRTRAAEHLAARPIALPAGQARLGLGAVHPVQARVVERQAVANRHADLKTPVAAAGLEQQHAVPSAGRQARGQHAAGRARADDDVVERRHRPERATGAAANRAAEGTEWPCRGRASIVRRRLQLPCGA